MVNAVTAWTMQESGGTITGNNPWNLHSPALGQSGSRYAGPGDTAVAVFPNLKAGVHAAVTDLIAHGRDWAHYDVVLAEARKGDPLGFLDALARSSWSAGRYGGPTNNRLVTIYKTLGAPSVAVPKVPTPSTEPAAYTGLLGSLMVAAGQIAQGGVVTATATNGITQPEAIALNAIVALIPFLMSLIPRSLVTPNASIPNIVATAVAAIPIAPSASVTPQRSSAVQVSVISSAAPPAAEGTIPAGTRRWALDGAALGTIGPSTLAFASEDFLSGQLNGHFLRTLTSPPVYVIAAEVTFAAPTVVAAPTPAPVIVAPEPSYVRSTVSSSNAASPIVDPNAFSSLYGYGPQDYVNRDAAALATLAAVARNPNRWIVQDGTGAVDTEIRNGDLARQAYAQQFAAGTLSFGAFRSYLGREANVLIDNGLVNGEEVRTAVQAAIATL